MAESAGTGPAPSGFSRILAAYAQCGAPYARTDKTKRNYRILGRSRNDSASTGARHYRIVLFYRDAAFAALAAPIPPCGCAHSRSKPPVKLAILHSKPGHLRPRPSSIARDLINAPTK
jgi:hypothetical protein